MSSSELPQIVIHYSPQFDLRFTCLKAERCCPTGRVEYCFEGKFRLRHPSGTFEYTAADLKIDPNSFARFAEDLRALQQGTRDDAVLKALPEMLELRLERRSSKLQADLKIREYIAPHVATLTAIFDVDYDLFVNKLLAEIENFVGELRRVEPDEAR
jgi:hypothetical protein